MEKKNEVGNSLVAVGFKLCDSERTYFKEYNSFLDWSFPFTGTESNGTLYRAYADESSDELHRELGVIKLDLNGDKVWQRNYSTHNAQNSVGGVEVIEGGELIVASKVQDVTMRSAQLLKIDNNGIEIDSVFSEEELLDFTSKAYLAVIDSQIIVNAYYVKREADNQPIRLDYYDEDLSLIDNALIPSTQSKRIVPTKLQNGKGNYFFILGSFIDFNGDLTYGYLSKIGLGGEIIWEHYYQHPDYIGEDFVYNIFDICEEENGDIYGLGSIFPITTQQEVWLFKLSDNGCFGTDTCDLEVILSTTVQEQAIEKIHVFPNPVTDYINIQSENIMTNIEVFDLQGIHVLNKEVFKRNYQLDVSLLANGVLHIKSIFSKWLTIKFIFCQRLIDYFSKALYILKNSRKN